MPSETDFTVSRAGAIIRTAALEELRAACARAVTLPSLPAIIGHARASAFAPVSLAQVQ